jgi:hypothetical protein
MEFLKLYKTGNFINHSNLKMETMRSSETSISFYQSERRYFTEYSPLDYDVCLL